MDIRPFLDWLESTDIALLVQQSAWAFPTAEILHVISICLVYGVIVIVDLKLIGVAGKNQTYSNLARESLRWCWLGFVIAVISGGVLFISQANAYFDNTAFKVKMLFIVLAGINMLIMEFITSKDSSIWEKNGVEIPMNARVAGFLSLSFWTIVIFCGRWIGFTMLQLPF